MIETSSGLCTANEKGRIEIYRKLLAAFEENSERLERTLPGMKKLLMAGNWLGKAPFGYLLRGKRTKDFTLHYFKQVITIDKNGELLKKAWRWKLQGEKDYVIRQKLDELGLVISKQKLNAMWSNPFYCGVNDNSLLDEPVKGNWEPMISKEDFYLIQNGGRRILTNKYNSETHDVNRPLSRFVQCAQCGNSLTGYENKKKKLHYYKCNVCPGGSFNANTSSKSKGLNDSFYELLSEHTLDPVIHDIFKTNLNSFFLYLNHDTVELVQSLKSDIEKQELELVQLQRNYMKAFDAIDPSVFENNKRELEGQILQKKSKLLDTQMQLSNPEKHIEDSINIASNLHKYWKLADYTSKDRIQRTVFPKGVLIDPYNRQYLTKETNQFFLAVRSKSSEYRGEKKEKVGIIADQSCLVAGARLELTTFGL